jgi:hypothetical protein
LSPTSHGISEADWKVFRRLRPIALERFCERVLSEIGQTASESGKGAHERYLALRHDTQRHLRAQSGFRCLQPGPIAAGRDCFGEMMQIEW